MRATTTKQLMDQSKLFRFLFWGSIVLISVGVICFIVFPFTNCNYRSCSWYYYNSYECRSGGDTYCCYQSATYCGNWNYCWYKPTQPCLGWMIAGSTLICSGFLMGIFVFVMFCNYRAKIRNGTGYLKMPPQQVFNPYQPQVIIYSDQNQPNLYPQYQQYAPAQQQYVPPQQQTTKQPINFSES